MYKDTFYILDRVKHRIVSFRDADDELVVEDIGSSVDGVDLFVTKSARFVFNAGSNTVERLSESGRVTSQPKLVVAGQEEVGGDNDARAAAAAFFVQGVSTLTSATSGNLEVASASAEGSDSIALVGPDQHVLTEDARILIARFIPSPLSSTVDTATYRGEIVFAPVESPTKSRRLIIRRNRDVKAAQLLYVTAAGNGYVDLEEIDKSSTGQERIRRIILEYDTNGNAVRFFGIPDSSSPEVVTRAIGVGNGRVYILNVSSNSARVEGLVGSNVESLTDEEADAGGTSSRDHVLNPHGALEVAAPSTNIARAEMLRIANGYVTKEWDVSSTAFGDDKDYVCDPPKQDFWKRPKTIQKVGQRVRGVPYCWGCKDSVDKFVSGITDGKLAGNTCTFRGCPECSAPSKSSGTDCSGFVANVWQLPEPDSISTYTIPLVGQELSSYSELRAGDVLNRAGRHVMVYVGRVRTSAGELVTIYDSSTTCGGTCERTLKWSSLKQYKLYRRPHVSD